MGLQGYTLFTLGGLVHFPHNSMKKGRSRGEKKRYWARHLARNTSLHIKSVEKHTKPMRIVNKWYLLHIHVNLT